MKNKNTFLEPILLSLFQEAKDLLILLLKFMLKVSSPTSYSISKKTKIPLKFKDLVDPLFSTKIKDKFV